MNKVARSGATGASAARTVEKFMTDLSNLRGPLRIGTRGSPLALWQARHVEAALRHAWPELAEPNALEIVEITTTGDRVQNRLLSEIGGKGLFSKEIEEALSDGRIDLAVHSMKDVETVLADGFVIAAVMERADPRDAWISKSGHGLDDMPSGARIGTASLRRRAQVLARRPDLEVVPFRGNVGTRLRKLAEGEADATLLAQAGLDRLEMSDVATETLATDVMLPAAAQGAVGIECRLGDALIIQALQPLNHEDTGVIIGAERALLAALDGSCRTPIGAFATLDGIGGIHIAGLLADEDGTKSWRASKSGAVADALSLGDEVGKELRRNGDAAVFE